MLSKGVLLNYIIFIFPFSGIKQFIYIHLIYIIQF